MIQRKEKWMVAAKRADFAAIGQTYGIDPVVARIIRNRDITEKEEIDIYLHGTLERLYSPHLLKDMDLLTEILEEKIHQEKKIRIIGDYDIDGIQSTYILLKGIRRAGGDVTAAIPDRILDGYGINENLIRQAKEDGADTIVTCDNGIAAIDAVAYAKELGMTVLVTDHHDIPFEEKDGEKHYKRSQADAIVNPKQAECNYPFSGICGAVVAWKVILALYERMHLPQHCPLRSGTDAAHEESGTACTDAADRYKTGEPQCLSFRICVRTVSECERKTGYGGPVTPADAGRDRSGSCGACGRTCRSE